MKSLKKTALTALPEDLSAYLQQAQPLTQSDLDELGHGANVLDNDPQWRADYLKGLFVEKVLAAMEQAQINQSQLAAKWGKTRQYVSKLFNEDERVNFTIETLCEVAHLLGLRVEIQLLKPAEMPHVLRTVPNKNGSHRKKKTRSR